MHVEAGFSSLKRNVLVVSFDRFAAGTVMVGGPVRFDEFAFLISPLV